MLSDRKIEYSNPTNPKDDGTEPHPLVASCNHTRPVMKLSRPGPVPWSSGIPTWETERLDFGPTNSEGSSNIVFPPVTSRPFERFIEFPSLPSTVSIRKGLEYQTLSESTHELTTNYKDADQSNEVGKRY